jgi:penicillin-binding protein 1C
VVELISPAARWLTLDALRDPSAGAPQGLAWKTGTSHGFRDAWACGVIGEWVLCVWIGHFDGKPMQGLFARETAAPLLFDLATSLQLPASTTTPPPRVTRVVLCSDSGDSASRCCPHTREGYFIAGVSPITACTVHREVFQDSAGRVVPPGTPETRRVVREFWPQYRLEQFRRAGIPRAEPPKQAGIVHATEVPVILSPQSTLTYIVNSRGASNRSIPLQARAGTGIQKIHWFANSQYLGASRPGEPLLWSPTSGHWTIQAVDERGGTHSVTIHVSHSPE